MHMYYLFIQLNSVEKVKKFWTINLIFIENWEMNTAILEGVNLFILVKFTSDQAKYYSSNPNKRHGTLIN